jgi:DnaJ-class molecular chaperone
MNREWCRYCQGQGVVSGPSEENSIAMDEYSYCPRCLGKGYRTGVEDKIRDTLKSMIPRELGTKCKIPCRIRKQPKLIKRSNGSRDLMFDPCPCYPRKSDDAAES